MLPDFDDAFKDILNKHSSLFENLTSQEEIDKLSLTPLERDAFYQLLSNKEEIKREIDAAHNSAYYLLPAHIIDIYIENFKTNALNIIKTHISQYNLTPESITSIINYKYIDNILGKEFLCPPKK